MEDIDKKIRFLYTEQHMTLSQISKEVGFSAPTITAHLKKMQIPVLSRKDRWAAKSQKIRDKLFQLYTEDNTRTLKKFAELSGVTPMTVRRHLRAMKCKLA